MATTVAIAAGSPSAQAVGNQTLNFTVTVANTGAAALTLSSLVVNQGSFGIGTVRCSQPGYLIPNVPVGVGNPVIPASSSSSFSFQAVVTNPVMPGASPQAPGGADPTNDAFYPSPMFSIQATAVTSDGVVASGSYVASALTATFPQSNGGALVLSQGFNVVNLVAL